MKTFREFVAERYYEPDEPLPSGKTPYGKATSSYYRQRGEVKRDPNRTSDNVFKVVRQGSRRNNEVSRGADNPDFDLKPDKSGRYDVSGSNSYRMSLYDRKHGLEMRVRQRDQIAPGNKPVYDVEWYNHHKQQHHNPGEARRVTRNVADMWKNQVAPRLPSNSVLTNFPITNDTSDRNTRSKMYSKVAGFGKPGMTGRQYANVGRNPSPKQAAKGAQRITPLSGNLNPRWADRDELIDLDAKRLHLSRKDRIRLDKEGGTPRKIAPAKPSRPLANRAAQQLNQSVRQLKATPRMNAPTLPKPSAIKPPITPKVPNIRIRGGRAALAAGLAVAGAGALTAALNRPKK